MSLSLRVPPHGYHETITVPASEGWWNLIKGDKVLKESVTVRAPHRDFGSMSLPPHLLLLLSVHTSLP